jgi:hypothetical protein
VRRTGSPQPLQCTKPGGPVRFALLLFQAARSSHVCGSVVVLTSAVLRKEQSEMCQAIAWVITTRQASASSLLSIYTRIALEQK